MTAGQRDIRRLQIAMDDPFVVCGFECFGYLFGDRQRVLERQWTACDRPVETFTVHEFEYEEFGAVRPFETVDLRNVWMVEGRKDLRFPAETRQTLKIVHDAVGKGLQ